MSDATEPDCCAPGVVPRPAGGSSRRQAVPLFRALSDPTRVEILALIASRPDAICVCDVVAHFDLKQPTISHHLRVLRKAGLVGVTRRGTWAYYALDVRGIEALRRAVDLVVPGHATATATP